MEGNVDLMIIDDFIKDEKLLKRLANTKGEFWEKGFSWWSGWWDSPIETLRHELIHKIWGEKCPMQFNGITCAGFEHWIGRYGEGQDWQYLDTHKDKDETLYEKTGEFVYPKIGTVFYPIDHKVEGGELMVYSGDEYPTDDTPADIILPKYNRLIIFDASKWHCVKEITKGTRYAIAINLWDKKPLAFK